MSNMPSMEELAEWRSAALARIEDLSASPAEIARHSGGVDPQTVTNALGSEHTPKRTTMKKIDASLVKITAMRKLAAEPINLNGSATHSGGPSLEARVEALEIQLGDQADELKRLAKLLSQVQKRRQA